MDRHETAIQCQSQALDIRKSAHGEQHPEVARTLNDLAVLYDDSEQPEQAEQCYREALESRRATLGEHHQEVAQSLMNLAGLCLDQGRLEESASLYEQAVDVFRVLTKETGTDQIEVVTALNHLAHLRNRQDDFLGAEGQFLESIKICESIAAAGIDTKKFLAETREQLGLLYKQEGRYDSAAAYFQEALDLREKFQHENHADVIHCMEHLAMILIEEQQVEDAHPLLQRFLKAKRATLGGKNDRELADIHFNVGKIYADMDWFEDAVTSYEYAIEITRVADPEPGEIGHLYMMLGRVYADQEQPHLAMETFEIAHQEFCLHFGIDSEEALSASLNIGEQLINLQRYGEAEETLLEVFRTVHPSHPISKVKEPKLDKKGNIIPEKKTSIVFNPNDSEELMQIKLDVINHLAKVFVKLGYTIRAKEFRLIASQLETSREKFDFESSKNE
eukprot:TRINITY_DN3262_c0_g1_i7.p1 TRINITY_DN3262_c0_g1~~TRINITY_DN3262_c0_g1_i7.p1  ORF type:complete len:448 (+),score=144.18 TRINITY_DN3262_c0_g1_i7:640-1983(+)